MKSRALGPRSRSRARVRGRTRPAGAAAAARRAAVRADEGRQGRARVVLEPQSRLEQRQQAADPGRDDHARGPAGPRRRHAHLADDRRQRVRVAAPDAAARVLRRERRALRRRAGRRLLRRRPRVRAVGQVRDGACELRGPRAQRLLADAVREVLPDHADERGAAARRPRLLPRGLVEGPGAPAGHALLPRALQAGAAGAGGEEGLHVPRREGPGLLRRHGPERHPARGRLVRRGRRAHLRRRREGALDQRDGLGGLLQRRLGAARGRRAVHRRHRGRRHGPRLPDDGLSLAHQGPDSLQDVLPVRPRAPGLDLQQRRVSQVALRHARRPDVLGRVLVPGGRRDGALAGAVRVGAAAAGQRQPDRGREGNRRGEGGEGRGLALPGPLLVQGRR